MFCGRFPDLRVVREQVFDCPRRAGQAVTSNDLLMKH
jgi:hypothetical protein